jgi:competence protein ComEC
VVAVVAVVAGACDRRSDTVASRGSVAATAPLVVISEVLANPRAVADEHGEWLELHNLEQRPIDLRGWVIASEHDRGVTIDRSVVIAPGGFAIIGRDANRSINGGVDLAFVFDNAIALGNGADWIALRSPDGVTVDSVAWTSTIPGASRTLQDEHGPHGDVLGPAWVTSTLPFGRGDLGSPGAATDADVRHPTASGGAGAPAGAGAADGASTGAPPSETPSSDSTLTVRLLDVGQGDAILIENGGSRVLIDGGPEPGRYGRLLDSLGITGSTVDAVILTHQHFDHYAGLRELFRSRRRIAVRYLFENRDPYSATTLARLRDSVIARARRGELVYRDTDDPCGTATSSCTITLRGGARLHVLRPDPRGDGPNNRSAVVKLVGPDSSRFTMWLAGDAEQQEIAWFDAADYDRAPGMRATVLKGDHHGSCDGISPRYLDLVRPEVAVLSLAAVNDYGYVHEQTLELLHRRRIPWYRTDQNGTITITVPPDHSKYRVTVDRGGPNMRGPSDRTARSCGAEDGRRKR